MVVDLGRQAWGLGQEDFAPQPAGTQKTGFGFRV